MKIMIHNADCHDDVAAANDDDDDDGARYDGNDVSDDYNSSDGVNLSFLL